MTTDLHDKSVAEKVARAELVKRVLIVVTAALAAMILVAVFLVLRAQGDTLDAVRKTQQTGSPVLRAIADQQDQIESAAKAGNQVNEVLADCLQPGGKCYQESQERQALIYYVLVCQDLPGVQSLKQLQTCAAALQARNQTKGVTRS